MATITDTHAGAKAGAMDDLDQSTPIEDLGRNRRVEGLNPPRWNDEPETVSAPLPRGDRDAWDPNFEGDASSQIARRVRLDGTPVPMAHAHTTPQGERSAAVVAQNLEAELQPKSPPRHAAPHAERAPFVREPVPHKTQPAVNLMDADDEDERIDYTHESDFTTRRGSMLSGAGYRRSRSDEKRFKEGLKYGQYLEVPKGRRDLFATKAQMRNRTLALVAIAAVAVCVVVWLITLLVTR